jgi:hypothetical protein
VGDDSHFMFRHILLGKDKSVRRGVVMVKQPGLFALKFRAIHFHAVTAKCSRTQNSQFGLLGLELHATSTAA